MSLTPGFILTDEYGDSIGLTLTEVAAVVGEWDSGPSQTATHIRGADSEWALAGRTHILVMRWEVPGCGALSVEIMGCGCGVYVGPDDIAEMRAVLAAQGAA